MKDYQVSAEEMAHDTRDISIIDLRKPEDFEKGSCSGAVNIYWEEFEDRIPELPKEKPLYLICYTGETSDELAEDLCGRGLEAYSVREGYRGYLRWKLR